MTVQTSPSEPQSAPLPSPGSAVLMLAALGVVFGDIGTSPLYALRECFNPEHGLSPTPENVLGVLSLIFWSLILIVSIKYLVLILRADNEGEGGILALMALVLPRSGTDGKWRELLPLGLGLLGGAMLYGDGMITPAISVLSAVEGLEVAAPHLDRFVLPISTLVLMGLFLIQPLGTASIGRAFGPIMLLWFGTLAVLGGSSVLKDPQVLWAADPTHAVAFFVRNRWVGFAILGLLFLAVTGAEALYADIGHFGKRPVRRAWFILVLPALLLNYFGQGALLLRNPAMAASPFYHLAPTAMLFPLIALSTLATVIASQAVITGAFSLTQQAVQLDLLPTVTIRHTSAQAYGQIYVPVVSWALLLSCLGLVWGFRSSDALAAAYGVAVVTTMAATTLLAFFVMRQYWKWPLGVAVLVTVFFLSIDLSFLLANLIKIPDGGWLPLGVGMLIVVAMSTWRRGRQILNDRLKETALAVGQFFRQIETLSPERVPGTAVYLRSQPVGVPSALVRMFQHFPVLHERNIVLIVVTERTPYVATKQRLQHEELGYGFHRLTLHYGFMEQPNVPRDLVLCSQFGLELNLDEVTYYLTRQTLLASRRRWGMALWREHVFSFMARNAASRSGFFGLPPERVLEIGAQIEL